MKKEMFKIIDGKLNYLIGCGYCVVDLNDIENLEWIVEKLNKVV